MGYQDVAFMLSRTNFSTTCIKNCGRGKNLWTTTCHKMWLEYARHVYIYIAQSS